MDARNESPPDDVHADVSSPIAEVVFLNGRQESARRPLTSPCTLIGRAVNCDMRFNVAEVEPLHCVLVMTATGPLLRDLQTGGLTFVNGDPVAVRCLLPDDIVAVGPIRFQVRCLTAPAGPTPAAKFVERARRERANEETCDLENARQEVAEDRQLLHVERKRLQRLRQRLKHRWHKHWARERAQLRRLEAEVENEHVALQAERERHRQGIADFHQRELRFNAKSELSRRHLRADRNLLCVRRNELAAQERVLKMRESAVQEAEQALVRAQQQWHVGQSQREREIHGLENRIANYRSKLSELQEAASRLQDGPAAQASVAVPLASAMKLAQDDSNDTHLYGLAEETLRRRSAELEYLAGALADQRACLADQLERVALAQQRWNHDCAQATTELEALAPQILEQEQCLRAHAEALKKSDCDLQRRQCELRHQRKHLEAWQARLTVESLAWQGDRAHLLADLRKKEGATMEMEEGKLKLLVEASRLQRTQYEQQLRELREEVERLARVLLDDTDVPAAATGKAA